MNLGELTLVQYWPFLHVFFSILDMHIHKSLPQLRRIQTHSNALVMLCHLLHLLIVHVLTKRATSDSTRIN